MDFRPFKVFADSAKYGTAPLPVLAMKEERLGETNILEGTYILLADERKNLDWVKLRDVKFHSLD